MNTNNLEKILKQNISSAIVIKSKGLNRFCINTPFRFDDGDLFKVILQKTLDGYKITDEAHTFMHLSYDLDLKALESGTRSKIITQTLSNFNIEDRNGELIIETKESEIGDAVFSFIQGLSKITDISFLKK